MALTKVTKDLIDSLDASVIDTTGASNGDVLTKTAGGVVWQAPVGGSGGPQMYTACVNTSSTTGDITFSSIPFVVGQVYIEYLNNNSANQNSATTIAAGWVNLRSYNGTKTDDTTNRYSQIVYIGDNGGGGYQTSQFSADRNTSGTEVVVHQIQFTNTQSTAYIDTTVTLFSYGLANWNTGFSLRITAFEDMQS